MGSLLSDDCTDSLEEVLHSALSCIAHNKSVFDKLTLGHVVCLPGTLKSVSYKMHNS